MMCCSAGHYIRQFIKIHKDTWRIDCVVLYVVSEVLRCTPTTLRFYETIYPFFFKPQSMPICKKSVITLEGLVCATHLDKKTALMLAQLPNPRILRLGNLIRNVGLGDGMEPASQRNCGSNRIICSGSGLCIGHSMSAGSMICFRFLSQLG